MVVLVMVLKAAAIATLQFSSMDDCVEAKKALDAKTEIISVCVDKVAGAPTGQ